MVSVIIPAYNEEKLIGRCLDSLIKQKTKYQFEVVVVNNNSTDNTVKEVRKFADRLDIKIIFEKIKGRGPARKTGFENARGDIFLSTDADTILPTDWIETMVTGLIKSKAGAVTGSCIINDCNKMINMSFNLIQPISMRLYKLVFGHYWLSGFNFGIYKNVYFKAGGFSNTLNGMEDIELSFRVSDLGKIKLILNPKVVFSGRRFKNGVLKGGISYIKLFVDYFLFKKEKIVLSNIR